MVSVTLCELLLPTFTLPKLRLEGLAVNCTEAATPVPLNAIVPGELDALLTSEMLPVTLPADCGSNCALNVMLCPGGSVTGTESPPMVKPAPETWACEIVRLALPEFVKRMVCELVVPSDTLPKLTLLGFMLICPLWDPAPLPLSATFTELLPLLLRAILPLV